MPIELNLQSAPSGGRSIEGQPAGLVAVRETGLMWANMLGAFRAGKALTSDEGPASWMRRSCVALVQVSCPACHLTKASASAVMKRFSSKPGFVLQRSRPKCFD